MPVTVQANVLATLAEKISEGVPPPQILVLFPDIITGDGLTVNVSVCGGVPVHSNPEVATGSTLKVTVAREPDTLFIAEAPKNVLDKSPEPIFPTATPVTVPVMAVTVQL